MYKVTDLAVTIDWLQYTTLSLIVCWLLLQNCVALNVCLSALFTVNKPNSNFVFLVTVQNVNLFLLEEINVVLYVFKYYCLNVYRNIMKCIIIELLIIDDKKYCLQSISVNLNLNIGREKLSVRWGREVCRQFLAEGVWRQNVSSVTILCDL